MHEFFAEAVSFKSMVSDPCLAETSLKQQKHLPAKDTRPRDVHEHGSQQVDKEYYTDLPPSHTF